MSADHNGLADSSSMSFDLSGFYMELLSVNVAVVRTDPWTGRLGRTGIDKRPTGSPVKALLDGMSGDTVCDMKHHGGVDRAAYAFAAEDAEWWSVELGRPVSPGAFGENLTTRGVDVTGALIGERWRIGAAEFEVTGPRTPCRVFAAFWDVPDLVKRFIARGRPGAYLRVIEQGEIAAGDLINVTHRPDHSVTVGRALRAFTSSPNILPELEPLSHLLPEDLRLKVLRRSR